MNEMEKKEFQAAYKAAKVVMKYCNNRLCANCPFYGDYKGGRDCIFTANTDDYEQATYPYQWDMGATNRGVEEHERKLK